MRKSRVYYFCSLGGLLGLAFVVLLWQHLQLARQLPAPGPRPNPLHIAAAALALRAEHKDKNTSGSMDWRPRWIGRVPADLRGLGSKVWQALQIAAQPTAIDAAKQLLRAAVELNTSVTVVQVGACDGAWEQTNDPVQELLQDPRVRAAALEPVPYLWAELDKRLAALPASKGRLAAINAALCLEQKEHVPFYIVSPKFAEEHPEEKHWAVRELGSFKRSHLKKHHIPSEYIETMQVRCLAPPQLFELEESPVGRDPAAVDAVVVDAEGFDADLVRALYELPSLRPAVLIFEQKHVPRPKLREALAALRKFRYVHWRDQDQVVAVLAAPPPPPNTSEARAVSG